MRALARLSSWLGIVLLLAPVVHGQTGVGVELDEVVDNRISAGMMNGALELRLKLKGTGLDKASAARIVIKEARDDRGTDLSDNSGNRDFMPRDNNSGTLQVSVKQPMRAAGSVKMKGSVELFVPTRDPNAVVKIDKAFNKLDTPLSSKTLKAAQLEITPLSRAGYAEAMKARKLDDKEIERIRAEGKKRGVPEKEIELAIELAKAFESIDGDPPENAVILSGTKSDFDRIFRVEVLGADGNPVSVGSRTLSSRGDDSMMILHPNEPLPENASLQIFVLTDKSRMSFPFELKVPLP